MIAMLPFIKSPGTAAIQQPTYGEYAFAFENAGWTCCENGDPRVIVHPNNPDGRLSNRETVLDGHRRLTIIDKSFSTSTRNCHWQNSLPMTGTSFSRVSARSGDSLASASGLPPAQPRFADRFRKLLRPWPVSGPALQIGLGLLGDENWINDTRTRL